MITLKEKTRFRVSPLARTILGLSVAASIVWFLRSLRNPNPNSFDILDTKPMSVHEDSPERNFYDDPNLSYSIDKSVKDWDAKRRNWLKRHRPDRDRILVITGSQPLKCQNENGDHLLLRMFKNKVDYCRIHGYEIYYNNAFLHPKMGGYWAKYPIIRAAMLAHPEAEWIWWIDADAVFTDMDFKVPIERYKSHNLVINGWPNMIYKDRSWVGLNAGVFLIRNCQWSMTLMEVWAGMGPQTPRYQNWGKIQKSVLKDKVFPASDDQSGLIYLLLKQNKRWADKIYLETEYGLHGYWLNLVDTYEKVNKGYIEIEKGVQKLRRRHAEKQSEVYGELWELYIKDTTFKRRPFITHFTGCQPCNGEHNPAYTRQQCLKGMENALNYADNQVLRQYGFVHPNLSDSSVTQLPFDFPASSG
ncbi:galactomannan galactosyltransferase 1-like [Tripterygium wilfordii]|uniref:Galactomannan galactosyltransferase 1-like n=1 Tax=Tripterygium wilfordii TaxID=458696 RepID=A0A7J7C9N0_TRIWF|nr:galactomannan galactosyltransferase 1-like [Tripterygium wilfordii]KAF5730810.1 galactomannan galactosyltransferase 1-like [Tripterygium wilfordii]